MRAIVHQVFLRIFRVSDTEVRVVRSTVRVRVFV